MFPIRTSKNTNLFFHVFIRVGTKNLFQINTLFIQHFFLCFYQYGVLFFQGREKSAIVMNVFFFFKTIREENNNFQMGNNGASNEILWESFIHEEKYPYLLRFL